ncbi:hypothetical protein MG293_008705 [Ovis ammon polii]|uniref:Long-chain-fatty-acid--CoA ligase ACSBG2 n=1 Tax=Ovis ammon polii TaxID=230172 RepID=A0AAD4U6T8_OVIAM|nr:hypothetical protein MG293_008705 [Ovis ammon polii]
METLKAIVQYKPPVDDSKCENLYSWDDFLELGSSIPDAQLDQIIKSQKVNQCAVIIYTSGTTGQPKGVMLSHDNITWTAGSVARDCNLAYASEKQEVVVSYLPLSHIAAQMMDVWVPIKVGAFIYFAEPDALKGTLVNTLQEVKPTAFLGVPRIWEKMHEKIKEAVGKSSSLRKKVFLWARNIGLKVNLKRMLGSGKVVTGCKNMLYQPSKDGVGEVCLWGRHVFMGYLEQEDATREAIDEEGWLHSGDLGRMDNQGFLFITGRIKEIIITAGGENVAPGPIENLVKETIPIISNAMLVGDKAKFLSILLTLKCEVDKITGEPLDVLNWEAIKFCQEVGSQATTVSEILELRDPMVYAAIQKGISAVNQKAISNAQKIQKWVILEKDFSISGGELGYRYWTTKRHGEVCLRHEPSCVREASITEHDVVLGKAIKQADYIGSAPSTDRPRLSYVEHHEECRLAFLGTQRAPRSARFPLLRLRTTPLGTAPSLLRLRAISSLGSVAGTLAPCLWLVCLKLPKFTVGQFYEGEGLDCLVPYGTPGSRRALSAQFEDSVNRRKRILWKEEEDEPRAGSCFRRWRRVVFTSRGRERRPPYPWRGRLASGSASSPTTTRPVETS